MEEITIRAQRARPGLKNGPDITYFLRRMAELHALWEKENLTHIDARQKIMSLIRTVLGVPENERITVTVSHEIE